MDLELSDDQFALRDGIRSLLTGRFDSDRIRAGYDRALHEELAEAGVFSLLADGFTWADAAVVFEQLGEFCVPGPLVASFLAGEPASIVEAHDGRLVLQTAPGAGCRFKIALPLRSALPAPGTTATQGM